MLNALAKLFRNTLFRLSLLGAVLFVVSLLISLAYVYFATISSELRRVDQELVAEMEELQDVFDQFGGAAVQQIVFTRIGAKTGAYELALSPEQVMTNIITEDEERISDLLSRSETDSVIFEFNRIQPDQSVEEGVSEKEEETQRVRARSGYIFNAEKKPVAALIVGRDIEALRRTADRVRNAMFTSSGIALVLGLLSSLFVSRRFTRRVEAFNRLATDVRAGQLDRRAPRNYSEDELDMLAEHLNAMLDHIDRLMKAMRYAGDSIAHDLRSPLTRLRTRLESTASDLKDPDAAEAMFSAAEDADELLATFDKVLRIARLEAGEQREMLEELDPKIVLEDMAEFYEPACEDANLSFESRISDGNVIFADRGLLSQAVSNLVENAIKYTPDGGTVRLELYRDKANRVVVAVTDNGPGIPATERERVKERFVRLDKSRTAPGSGLGLAMVDAIAALHQAEFALEDGIESEFGPGLSVQIIFPRRRHLKPASFAKVSASDR